MSVYWSDRTVHLASRWVKNTNEGVMIHVDHNINNNKYSLRSGSYLFTNINSMTPNAIGGISVWTVEVDGRAKEEQRIL